MPLPTDKMNDVPPPPEMQQTEMDLPPAPPPSQKASRQVPPPPPEKQQTKNVSPPPPPTEAESSKEVATVEESSKEIATVEERREVSTEVNYDTSVQALEDEGFEGLEYGFLSYKTVTLGSDGIFRSSAGEDLGSNFLCQIKTSKRKFYYANGLGSDDPERSGVYSYDRQTSSKGESLENVFSLWKNKGWKVKESIYLDVQAVRIHSDGVEELVNLQIPRQSIQRISGYVGQLKAKYGFPAYKEVTTRVFCGTRVTKAVQPFYPWDFQEAHFSE